MLQEMQKNFNIDWFQNFYFQKGPKNQQFLKKFCISCSIFIVLFNGPLFVFIMSMVGGTQKETLLLSHLNWPPLYITTFASNII